MDSAANNKLLDFEYLGNSEIGGIQGIKDNAPKGPELFSRFENVITLPDAETKPIGKTQASSGAQYTAMGFWRLGKLGTFKQYLGLGWVFCGEDQLSAVTTVHVDTLRWSLVYSA